MTYLPKYSNGLRTARQLKSAFLQFKFVIKTCKSRSFFIEKMMPLVIFTKNMMTDGGPAKAHSIGRVSTERGSECWVVQVDHHTSQTQAENESGIVWQTYYQMPFYIELGGNPYAAAAAWLIENVSIFSGGEIVPQVIIEDTDL